MRPTTRTALMIATIALFVPALAAADPPARPRRARRTEVQATIRVHGVVQRPQAFNLSSRAPSDYRARAAESRFTPQVVTATRRAPF